MCCWRPASESNAVLPGSLPEARFRRAGHVVLWCPANESNVERPESESRAWVPPGGARVCWSRQRESHSRSARTGRVSYCWTMTACVWVERIGLEPITSEVRAHSPRLRSSHGCCWCPRKGSNLRLPEVSRMLVHRAAWAFCGGGVGENRTRVLSLRTTCLTV